MMELTINGQVYAFNFGMGFMRKINKTLGKPIDGIPGEKENIGLQFRIAGIISGDVEALAEVLFAANEGQTPRVTQALIDSYIDDENTDIDALFDLVIDFLKKANATKKATVRLLEEYKRQTAEAQS